MAPCEGTGRRGTDDRAGSKISSTPPSGSRSAALSSDGSSIADSQRHGVEACDRRDVGRVENRLVDAGE
jgi:hypothetical protein